MSLEDDYWMPIHETPPIHPMCRCVLPGEERSAVPDISNIIEENRELTQDEYLAFLRSIT
jgi:hypothetical protein